MHGRRKQSNKAYKLKSNNATSNSPLLDEWHKYEKKAKDLILTSGKIVAEHDFNGALGNMSPHDPKTIYKLEGLLNEFNDLNENIAFFEIKLNQDINTHLNNQNLLKVKSILAVNLFHLKKSVSDKYIFAHRMYTSIKHKIKFLEKSKCLLNEIKASYEGNNGIAVPVTNEVKNVIEHDLTFVTQSLLECNPDPNDQIAIILIEARSKTDKEEAYKIFEDTLKLTDDNTYKFLILFYQGQEYYKKLHGKYNEKVVINNTEDLTIVTKATQPKILATQIIINMPTVAKELLDKCEVLCSELYFTSELLINYCKKNYYTFDLDTKFNILNNASSYINCANELIDKLFSIYKLELDSSQAIQLRDICLVYRRILDQLPILVTQLSEEMKQAQEAIKVECIDTQSEEVKQKLEKEMDDRINQLIEEFDGTQKRRQRNRTSRPSKPLMKNTTDQCADSDEETSMTQVNLTPNPVYEKFAISLDEQTTLLNEAKEHKDFVKQIKINVIIAEYYRIQSLKFRTQSHIKSAHNYIVDSHQAFIQAKMALIPSLSFLEHEKCISIVLQNITKLLNQFILREQRIKQINLDEHEKVKDDYIKKHGHDAWYRNDADAKKRYAQSSNDISDTLDELESMKDTLDMIFKNYIHLSDQSHPTSTTQSKQEEEQQPICNLDELSNAKNTIILEQLKSKLRQIINKDIQTACQEEPHFLNPLIEPSQLMNYFLYHCIYSMSEACFNLVVHDNFLPYMLPISSSNWPFPNEVITALQSELRQLDQFNTIPTLKPKDPWVLLGHFIMAILAHTDTLSLPHQDLIACINDYLPMNLALAKSIETYQHYYLKQQHASNQVNHLARLSMFSGTGTVTTQEQARDIPEPTSSTSPIPQ